MTHDLQSTIPVVLSLKVADRDKPGTAAHGKLVLYKETGELISTMYTSQVT